MQPDWGHTYELAAQAIRELATPDPWEHAVAAVDAVTSLIQQLERERTARSLDWLNLTDATVVIADQGQRIVFAFTHKHSLAQDDELLQRLRASIPGREIVIVDGVNVGVGETEYPTIKEEDK